MEESLLETLRRQMFFFLTAHQPLELLDLLQQFDECRIPSREISLHPSRAFLLSLLQLMMKAMFRIKCDG